MISKENLQGLFEHARQRRKEDGAQIDIDGVCKWSYFFIDKDRSNLTRIGLHLEDHGYRIAGFLEPSPDDDDQKTLYLRADRIEKHTVESLHETNQEFYALAEKMGVEGYDGMEVGAIDSTG